MLATDLPKRLFRPNLNHLIFQVQCILQKKENILKLHKVLKELLKSNKIYPGFNLRRSSIPNLLKDRVTAQFGKIKFFNVLRLLVKPYIPVIRQIFIIY